MPFTIKALKLPFLRISSSPKKGRSLVWHVGPWQYNTRTGQHTVKVSRTVRYVSRTRTEKAAAAKKRSERRASERAAWDSYFAGGPGAAAPTKAKPGPARKTSTAGRSRPARTGPAATRRPAKKAATTDPAAPTGENDPVFESFGSTDREVEHVSAGLCGQKTRDGSPCQRQGTCPPGTHHPHRSTSRKKAHR